MENNDIQKVEFEELCPVCKEVLKFKITKDDNRNYKAYITKGCNHFAEEFINQSKYRMIVNMLKALYEDVDLLYARMKKKEEIEKMKLLGIDITKYL